MPRSASVSTPCRDSADRTHPSQLASQAQEQSGNACSFSIGWPPQFQSRTGDPKDPCYIGRNFDAQRNTPRADQRIGGTNQPFVPPGVRVKAGTNGWHLWRLIVKTGPMKTNDIARLLGMRPTMVAGSAAHMVKGGALKVSRLDGTGRQYVYSLGQMPVVEV